MLRINLIIFYIANYFSGFAQNIGVGTNSANYPLTVIAKAHKGIVQKKDAVEIGFFTDPNYGGVMTLSNHNLNFATNNASAQMTLTTVGNLGIGTTVPTARLDVNGTVRIRGGSSGPGRVLTAKDNDGNAEWKFSPLSGMGMVHIPYAAFLPENSINGFKSQTTSGRRIANATFGTNRLMAPLMLPAGTVIKEITWYFLDQSQIVDLTFKLMRDHNGTATVVSQISSTGGIVVVGGRNLVVPMNYTLGSQYHWLEVHAVGSWHPEQIVDITGVKILYE